MQLTSEKRSTVYANGTQTSGLVNFVPESRLPYVQIKSVPFTGKEPRRPDAGIKDSFEEMEIEFSFGTFCPEKQDFLFKCSVATGNVPPDRPEKSCSIYFPTGFSGNFLYW